MKPHVLGFVFARGGSKGVPRKNIRPLAGKPLITYAIETAKQSRYIERIIVSTDDKEIAEISGNYGAEVPFIRPSELAQDKSPELLSWRHAITMIRDERKEPLDIFVSIPTTSPLRSPEDVDACITTLIDTDADLVVTVKASERSPYFNMVTLDKNGYARLVIPPGNNVHRRQDVPEVFDMTTVAYAARPEYIMKTDSLLQGKVRVVEVPRERALDIDTELDFTIADFLMRKIHARTRSSR